ncbi:MAG: aspartate--tRNA ligase [Sumerlaeia bacterium]
MTTSTPQSPSATSLSAAKRSMYCGEPRANNVGETLVLKGWVHLRRDHGGLVFIDLRDRTGLVQLRIDPDHVSGDGMAQAHHLRYEYCIAVRGQVVRRPEGSENPRLDTGAVEIVVADLEILAPSKPLPFQIDEWSPDTGEEIRLRYRFLDLRRPEMQRNFLMRHKLYTATRNAMNAMGFLEFETPILGKATPEGARDFLVPSRLSPGEFYALPQSPQLFKQLLMVSGYDRYYQIARCFRDEDLRANRQPEFTQIDVEMSFVDQDDVIEAMEALVAAIWRECLGEELPLPLPRMDYHEAMEKYGSDKPDLRFGLEIQDLSGVLAGSGFKVFDSILEKGGTVRALCVPGKAEAFSNSELRPDSKFSQNITRETGIKNYAWFKVNAEGKLESSIAKFLTEETLASICAHVGGKPGDVLFLVAGPEKKVVLDGIGRLRLKIGRENGFIDEAVAAGRKWAFTWVVDFPLFEYNPDEKRFEPLHHPFTSPHPGDLHLLDQEGAALDQIRSVAYDLALNGEEIGGGSIRIHRQDVQEKIFRAIGISDEAAREKFGFLLDALQYGAPPHGGLAFGFDRLLMLLLGEDNIRAVIPFPKTQTGTDLLTGAPSQVPAASLKELSIKTDVKKKEEKG